MPVKNSPASPKAAPKSLPKGKAAPKASPKKKPAAKKPPAPAGAAWRAAQPAEHTSPNPATTAPRDLTGKEMRFVDEYLVDLNATQAYLRSHPGAKNSTAATEGARLLVNPNVAEKIAERKAERAARVGITADRVLQEVARLSLFDPRKLFNANGEPVPIHELDDNTAAALAGLDVHEEYIGQGKDRKFIGYTKKYKLADKGANLERLMKHLGLFEKDNSQKLDPIAALLATMGRSSIPVVKEPGK